MRAVVQRVSRASVTVTGEVVGQIGRGFLVLLGVEDGDRQDEAVYMAQKIAGLRVFEDAEGKMNLGLAEVGGAMLVVSQFTLLASTRKGTRPSFNDAAKPEIAQPLYLAFNRIASGRLDRPVATGRFGALMDVTLENHGPVTLVIDSQVRK